MKQISRGKSRGNEAAGSPEVLSASQTDWRRPIISTAVLLVGFSVPLYQLVRFSLGHDLYSHIILIPFVSAYLAWLKLPRATQEGTPSARIWALLFLVAGTGMLVVYFLSLLSATPQEPQDTLALAMYSFVLLLTGICCWFLDRPTLRAVAFPLGFLIFIAPFPVRFESALESFLQHQSSTVAHVFFRVIGTPVFRDGTVFQLPGFSMQVAPECSGIHSTVALFITSLVAGQLLLRSTLSRTILALAVVPIALLRNGFRVTVIGELCVRIGPEMIDSYIHRHGGPIFFLLSLVPFGALLFFLLRIEREKDRPVNSTA